MGDCARQIRMISIIADANDDDDEVLGSCLLLMYCRDKDTSAWYLLFPL